MINSLLNSTLNRASFALSDSKDKILTIAKKRAQENLDFDIPSPQDFKSKLSGLDPNDITSTEQAQKIYNKTKSLLENDIKSYLLKLEAFKGIQVDEKIEVDKLSN